MIDCRTRAQRRIACFVGLMLGAAGLAHPVGAHHSAAMFDASRTVTIQGTLQLAEINNPHSWFWVSIANDGAEPTLWSVEGGAISSSAMADVARRSGLTLREYFAPGQTIVMTLHPLRTGGTGGQLVGIRFADGRVYGEAPPPPGQKSTAAPPPSP